MDPVTVEFNSPREVTIDGSGNIYVADAGNSRVEAFTSAGAFLWATQDLPGWTNSTGGCLYPERDKVCLNQPIGVGWDPVNNQLLVADTGDSYIKAFNPSGTWVSTSPSGKNTLGFTDPRGVTRGPGGYVWVSAYEQNQIKAYQVTGTGSTQTWTLKVTLGSTAGHGNNQLSFPYNVAFSPDNTYAYVSDIGNDRIAIYNISNLNSPTWVGQYGTRCNQPCGDPGQPKGDTGKFAFLRRVLVEGTDGPNPGAVFGDDFWGNGMNAWNPPTGSFPGTPGTFLEQVDGVHAPAPGFAQAFGVAVGPGATPDVYGVDRLNQRIEQFVQSTNAFVTASGVRGSTKVADGFSWPEDVAVAPDGSVWLADTRNSRIQHWPANLSATGVTDVGTKGSGHGAVQLHRGPDRRRQWRRLGCRHQQQPHRVVQPEQRYQFHDLWRPRQRHVPVRQSARRCGRSLRSGLRRRHAQQPDRRIHDQRWVVQPVILDHLLGFAERTAGRHRRRRRDGCGSPTAATMPSCISAQAQPSRTSTMGSVDSAPATCSSTTRIRSRSLTTTEPAHILCT